ncbi:hypothetical protein GGF31_001354 [Allomyces arbusculus]|nr:hypothetical protein GGF31_001354 [Allomyces arbusculus]
MKPAPRPPPPPSHAPSSPRSPRRRTRSSRHATTLVSLVGMATATLLTVLSASAPTHAALNVPVMQWLQLAIANGAASPSPRRDAVFVYEPSTKKILMFGGRTKDNVPLDDTWLLDIDTATWELIQQPIAWPARPPARYGAVAGADVPSSFLRQGIIMATGRGANNALLNDAWGFQSNIKAWSPIIAKGTPPPPMSGAVGGVAPDERTIPPMLTTLYLGLAARGTASPDGSNGSNDLFALTLKDGMTSFNYSTVDATWSTVSMSTSRPAGRTLAGGAMLPGERLLAFGGCTPTKCPTYDAWMASPSGQKLSGAGTWRQVNTCPPPRLAGSVAFRPDMQDANTFYAHAVLLGGTGDEMGPPGQVGYFDANGGSWALVLPDAATAGVYPENRAGAAVTSHVGAGAVVMFGGETSSGSVTNEVWLLKFQPANVGANKNMTMACYNPPGGSSNNGGINGGGSTFEGSPLVHGILMASSFTFFFTAAALVARYGKPRRRSSTRKKPLTATAAATAVATAAATGRSRASAAAASAGPQNVTRPENARRVWLWIHVGLNVAGMVAAGVGFYFAYSAKSSGHFTSPHGVLGFTLLCLVALQAIFGIVQPSNVPWLTPVRSRSSPRSTTRNAPGAARNDPLGMGVGGRAGAAGHPANTRHALNQALRDLNAMFGGGPASPVRARKSNSETGIGGFTYERFWNNAHQWTGLLVIYGGFANVLLGLVLAEAPIALYIALAVYVGVLLLVYLVLTMLGWPNRRSLSVRIARKLLGKKDAARRGSTGGALGRTNAAGVGSASGGNINGSGSQSALRGDIVEDYDEYDPDMLDDESDLPSPNSGSLARTHLGSGSSSAPIGLVASSSAGHNGTRYSSGAPGGGAGAHGRGAEVQDDDDGDINDRDVVIITLPKPKLRIVNT